MISVEEALAKILSDIRILEPEEKPILESLGQVLAEDVYSEINVPPLDNSAMDGYGLQWESIQEGLVLAEGTVLRPQEIGVRASLGRPKVLVIRHPIVAILATGNELVEVGHPLPPGKIYNINTFSLAAQVKRYRGIPKILGTSPDEPQVLSERIMQALDSDLLITSAGISVVGMML